MSTHRDRRAGHVTITVKHPLETLDLVELLYRGDLYRDYEDDLSKRPGVREIRKAVEYELCRNGSAMIWFDAFSNDCWTADRIAKLRWCSECIRQAYGDDMYAPEEIEREAAAARPINDGDEDE